MLPASSADSLNEETRTGIAFEGNKFAQIENGDQFDLTKSDYSIYARIKTTSDGTIFSQTKNQDQWMAQGKTFFLRGGRPTLDIGWVGAVNSRTSVSDGKWHEVVMTCRRRTTLFDFMSMENLPVAVSWRLKKNWKTKSSESGSPMKIFQASHFLTVK